MKITTCSQYKRISGPNGEVVLSLNNRSRVRFIPRHTPHVSIELSRQEAAQGLRVWRNAKPV